LDEADMREKLVELDLVDTVVGLGKNLFYNSPMEACIVICQSKKPSKRKGRVLFIDGVNEVTRERSMSYLKVEHQDRVAQAYHNFEDVYGFAKVSTLDEIRAKGYSLSIQLHVTGQNDTGLDDGEGLEAAIVNWENSSKELSGVIDKLLETFDGLGGEVKA
jgi:type I restriction enzyme M protein